jgi:hypothetical protein
VTLDDLLRKAPREGNPHEMDWRGGIRWVMRVVENPVTVRANGRIIEFIGNIAEPGDYGLGCI